MVPFLLLRRLECRWPFRFLDRRGANVVSVALFGVRVVEVKAGQVRRELESHRLDHGTATIHWCAQIVATGGEVIREAEAVPTGATIGRTVEGRSEEHTSELQSHSDLVCRLLLEKKKE